MAAFPSTTDTGPTDRLGPIFLAPGVSKLNVLTKLYAAFISIAMFTGMSFLNAYILEMHLGYSRASQGTVSGELAFWTEIVSLLLMGPMGVLADRIGRRPVFVFGMSMIGIGYGLYPFATTIEELLAYRLVYAVGLAATATMLATLTNDYPQENSRGKLIGVTSAVNVAGVTFMATGIAQLPRLLEASAFDPVHAGQVTFLLAAGLCAVTAVIAQLGLKGGTPVAMHERESVATLATSGLRYMRNPRVALSYAGAFAARADLVIKGMFLSLWAIHDGALFELNPGQAMARFGLVLGLMNVASFVCAPLFGWLLDVVNRVSAAIVALTFAALGYLSMGIITSPLDYAMLPYFIVLGLGSSFMLKASLALVGQEAPIRERGSVIAVNGWFGALGILLFSKYGGIYFDAWGPWAPFVIAGAYQCLLIVAAVVIRIYAPGQMPAEPLKGKLQAAWAKATLAASASTVASPVTPRDADRRD